MSTKQDSPSPTGQSFVPHTVRLHVHRCQESRGVSHLGFDRGSPGVRRSKLCVREAGQSIHGGSPQRQRGWTGEEGRKVLAGQTRAQSCPAQSRENAQGLRVTHLCDPYLCYSPVWGLGQTNSAPGSPHLPPAHRWFEA